MKTHTIPGLVRFILSLVISTLLLSSCSRVQLPALHSDDVVIAFGDSLTAGYGVDKSQSYPSILAKLTGLNVVNAGISGETTTQGLKRLPEVLEQHQPKLVILLEGGNDVLQKVAESKIKSNLKQMIQLIKQSGASVLLVGVPEKRLFGSALDLYSELASELEIPLEEDIVASLMKRPSMKSDYVHFNQQGYQAMAEAIYEQLQNRGAVD
ncbi:arylesterase [Thiomicrorhabdus immobilis]|uniref:arylesterase n=1 Tax=Thiomicrorhabdus immobilis TaxID=2791037 RepID=UPI001F390167|nr:arylesterase [Thiomicrorhabdus immobilis]